jgi:hypothetical protein
LAQTRLTALLRFTDEEADDDDDFDDDDEEEGSIIGDSEWQSHDEPHDDEGGGNLFRIRRIRTRSFTHINFSCKLKND